MEKSGLSSRFDQALLYAHHLHRNQTRKGTSIPYISHLFAVTALVLEDGGDEDQAIAALLHDAVEDQGGRATLKEIEQKFGKQVADMVDSLSDAYGSPKPPWKQRKERYLAHLESVSPGVRRISLADKLHNARTLLEDLRREGPITFERFKGKREGTLWYFHGLVEVFQRTSTSPMVDELTQIVRELERLS